MQKSDAIRQNPRIQMAIAHLRRQADKLGLYRALLEILSDDIELRRQIEIIENSSIVSVPVNMRDSVQVERTREQIQRTADEISEQIEHLVELIITIILELVDTDEQR